jgi:hypothetical protein
MKSQAPRPATTPCDQGLAATIGVATGLEAVLDDRRRNGGLGGRAAYTMDLRSSRVHHRPGKVIKLHDRVAPRIDG